MDDLLIDLLKTLFSNQPIVASSAATPTEARMEVWSGAPSDDARAARGELTRAF
jgi:hypothetical protein